MPEGLAQSAVSTSDPATELLERADDLSALAESLNAVIGGSHGRLVFVGGEAGVGKTQLIRRFCDDHRAAARTLSGACEALFTPRPRTVSRRCRGHERRAGRARRGWAPGPPSSSRRSCASYRTDDDRRPRGRALGRRGHARRPQAAGSADRAAPALVLASYRDDELDHDHPLRIVMGELATSRAVQRLKLAPLSTTAVASLAEPHGVDAEELYRTTAGIRSSSPRCSRPAESRSRLRSGTRCWPAPPA